MQLHVLQFVDFRLVTFQNSLYSSSAVALFLGSYARARLTFLNKSLSRFESSPRADGCVEEDIFFTRNSLRSASSGTPHNSCCRITSSIVAPAHHTSVLKLGRMLFRTVSGAMYMTVPLIKVEATVCWMRVLILEMPKSHIFTSVRSALTSIFAGLTSPCTMFLSCKYQRPLKQHKNVQCVNCRSHFHENGI